MYKKLLFLSILLFFVPLSAQAASVPNEIKNSISKDLNNYTQQLETLTETSSKKGINKSDTTNKLGEGYPVSIINTNRSITKDVYGNETSDGTLQFIGYLFNIKGADGSKAIAFAEQEPKFDEITRISTDLDFEDEINKAKSLIGYNEDSKLIYDRANQIVALVSKVNSDEKVVLLKKSSLNNLKQFEILNFNEFIEQIRKNQQERSSEMGSLNEPTSGGGTSTPNNSSLSNNIIVTIIASFFLLIISIFTYYIQRKRRELRNSHK